jgi:hypothetical protein
MRQRPGRVWFLLVFGSISLVRCADVVSSAPVASVVVSPEDPTTFIGSSVQLTATLYDADGNQLSDREVVWTSSDNTVATADSKGVVVGVAAGEAIIAAVSEGVEGSVSVTIDGFASVAGGGTFSCGVRTDGAAYCWGYGFHGQLGAGSTSESSTPVPVSGGHSFASLSAGFS